MSDFYDKNLTAFRKRYGRDVTAIGGIVEANEGLEIESDIARDGDVFFVVRRGDAIYRLNSSYAPQHEANRWSRSYRFRDVHQDVQVFGFGSGHHIRALLTRGGEDTRFFLYEPSVSLFLSVCRNCDIADLILHPQVRIIIGDKDKTDFNNAISSEMGDSGYTRAEVVPIPGYMELFPDVCEDYRKELRQRIEGKLINSNTKILVSQALIRNNLYMLRHLYRVGHIDDLRQRIVGKDITFILVSSGPSLSKNVDLLKQAKGKAIIVGYNYSTKVMQDHGFLPDLLAHIDPRAGFSFIPKEAYDLPMMCHAGVQIDVQKTYRDHIIFSGFDLPVDFIKEVQGVSSIGTAGGSVAIEAFCEAVYMGAKRIILVGQDLALAEDGNTHIKGRPRDEFYRDHDWDDDIAEETEGYYGGTVLSKADFLLFLRSFESLISQVKGNVEVINATEGGAMIHGAVNMPLAEAIERYCAEPIDCESLFPDLPRIRTKKEQQLINERMRSYLPEWASYAEDFDEIADILEEMREIALAGELHNARWEELNEHYKALDGRWKSSETADFVQYLTLKSTTPYEEATSHTGGEDAIHEVYDGAIASYRDSAKEMREWVEEIRKMF